MPKPTTKRVHHFANIFALLLFTMTLISSIRVNAGAMQQVIVTPGERTVRTHEAAALPDVVELSPLEIKTPDLSNSYLTDIKVTPDAVKSKAEAASNVTDAVAASECSQAAATAKTACLMPGTGGMSEGNAMMYTMMMNQLVTSASQIASIGKNMAAQCRLQADVAKVMTTINGVKGAACVTTINKCDTACVDDINGAEKAVEYYTQNDMLPSAETEKAKIKKYKTISSTCQSYSSQVAAMMMGAMQSLGSFAANSQCANDLAALSTTTPTYSPIAMPTIGDCTDPNNQSLTCYCAKTANATSAMCAGYTGGTTVGGSTTTTPNGTSVTSPYASTADSGDTTDPFAVGAANKAGSDSGTPGSGGSGAPGSGGMSAMGSEGGGMGAGGDPKSAITGTSGGTGSGLGGAGGGAGGGLARNNGTAKSEGFLDKFNLKKFLPGSKYKARGIAGMSVKSVDGITGPMGPSIWEKATRQYQEQIQKQNVILEK